MTSVLSAVPYATNAVGLRAKPTYEQLVEYIEKDPDKIKYPDRRTTILRNSHWLSQLDGEGWNTMEAQLPEQQRAQQQQLLLHELANVYNH
jgi:hypothetical protein